MNRVKLLFLSETRLSPKSTNQGTMSPKFTNQGTALELNKEKLLKGVGETNFHHFRFLKNVSDVVFDAEVDFGIRFLFWWTIFVDSAFF